MALVGKTVTIGDKEYIISQFDALMAMDVGCLAQLWRARQFGKASTGLADRAQLETALFGSLELIAQMYSNSEYRSKVFWPTLELCTCQGKPVIDRDGVWKLIYAGAELLNLLKLFQAALEHACGGFFGDIGRSGDERGGTAFSRSYSVDEQVKIWADLRADALKTRWTWFLPLENGYAASLLEVQTQWSLDDVLAVQDRLIYLAKRTRR